MEVKEFIGSGCLMKARTFITCRKLLGQRWEVTAVEGCKVTAVRRKHWEKH